nr:putative gustatory receptor 28b [Nomia melanderi]
MTRKVCSPSVYSMFLLFWLLFKVLGLATASLRSGDSKSKQSARLSFATRPLGTIYNVLLCCAILVSSLFSIPALYIYEYANKSSTTTVIEKIQGISGYLMILGILLYYCVNQPTIKSIGNCLIRVEGKLRLLRYSIDHKRIVWILTIVYVLHIVLFFVTLVTQHVAFLDNPLIWFTDVFPTTLANWLLIQYFSVISLMKMNFVCANHVLRNLCSSSHAADSYAKYLCRSRRVFVNSSTIQSLLQLRNIYDDLFDVSKEISDFYSLPILIGIPFLFYTLLYNFYYLLQPLIIDHESLELLSFVNTVIWIMFLIYPIGLLTVEVTNLLNEVEKIGILVHSLLKCAINGETKSELKQFSLQLLHRKIKFTSYGYFSLDNSMFLSMLGSMSAYLIILLQFQLGSSVNSCNCTESEATLENETLATGVSLREVARYESGNDAGYSDEISAGSFSTRTSFHLTPLSFSYSP